ncbi:MAG: polyketide synthase dehydratase domain-containing protein, partial [Oscillospiraceae bacterium]|nr:polyketide synthase dehydratase domain-containing protein [Oscillospiraceae bacterium]
MNQVKKFILTQLAKGTISQNEAVSFLKEIQNAESGKVGDIAIIGMACRLPMAGSKEQFWDNIVHGRSCFVSKPADKLRFEEVMENPHYGEFVEMVSFPEAKNLESFIGGYIPDNDKFDADFFNISPREARYIEPGQRVFMELAWAAIEDAGYSGNTIRDTLTGVFVGKDYSNSMYYKQITAPDPMKVTGTWEGLLASRVSYAFNLRGPTMVIDTACSSGLVAVHEACNALRNHECDMALAGGLSIGAGGNMVDGDEKYNSKNNENSGTIGAVTSNDNQVRTFDKKCSGSVFGEGVVVFMLKPYETACRDRDHVYAVIKGSAINNDGASNGITAPNPLAQEAVILDAWKRAGVQAESIDYVEAHGTGTLLGDPIEIIGLTNAFAKHTDRKQFCGIGSVKTNVGHLVAASGCASLLKVSMALQNQLIPPSINFEEPNQNIDFLQSPVFVVDRPTSWPTGEKIRRAGINAFGFSGTNCHMVVEEAPAPETVSTVEREYEIITISGRTETALHNLIREYCRFLATKPEISFGDMCYTANVGRGHYSHRLAVVASSQEELLSILNQVVANDFNTDGLAYAYMGKHRIVSDKYQNRGIGEITEKELRTLSFDAQELMKLLTGSSYEKDLLDRLAQAYAMGAGVDWSALYEGRVHYKVSLPTYCFDRIVCWGDPKVSELTGKEDRSEADKLHPIVERMLSDSLNETIFLARFDLSKHWFVQEHKIMGSNIVPGTAYIEFVKAACEKYFNSDQIQIKSISFIQPLVVGEEPKEAHIILRKTDNGVKFTVASKESEESDHWIIHSEGEACVHGDLPTEEFLVADYADDGEEIIIPIPEDETDELVYMGPRWHCVEHIYRNGDVLQSEIKLRDTFKGDLNQYHYHPSMADAALNIPLQVYINREMYLPLSYRNLKIYDKLPQRFFSRLVKLSGGNGSETMSFRVTFSDPTGKILAEIEEYTTKKVGKFNRYVANTYYGVRMQPVAKELT